MRRQGQVVRSRTDYILGTDRRLFQNVAVQDPRHNTDHYMVLGCLPGAPLATTKRDWKRELSSRVLRHACCVRVCESIIRRAEGALEDAAQALNLRGPDLQSTYHPKPGLGFAHARLSIIDTSESANQPMSAYDNRYTIVFNGEIYNYQELKQRLEKEKHEVFQTVSDTEVILRMFHHYGKACAHAFN